MRTASADREEAVNTRRCRREAVGRGADQGSLRDRRDPAARPRAGEDVRLGDPQGAPRPAGDRRCSSRWCRPGRSASDEVLVLVMAAGVNYNGVWAGARRADLAARRATRSPIHIAGSDASGIVWAVGAKVKRWKVGDEVVVHCNQDDGDDEECNGGDPMFSPSQRIWGYETPDGSFAQFCRVQSRQLMPRPKHLTWEEAACYTLTLATAYRMLFGHRAAHAQARRQRAGLGRLGRARRVRRAACAAAGANAIGVISDEDKRDYVMSTSAPRASSTARTSSAGARCPRSTRPNTTTG